MITGRRPKKHRPEMLIHLMDEAPAIGNGWRAIWVVTRGHKWVTVRDGDNRRAKFDLKLWASLERTARPVI